MSNLLDKIKEDIDAEELLNELGAEIISKNDNEINIRCLNPDHNDNNPSCNYNIDTHMWNCFGCDWGGDIITLVQKVKDLSYRLTISYLKSFISGAITENIEEGLTKRLILEYKKKKIKNVINDVNLPTNFNLNFNEANNTIKSYIKDRKLNTLICNKYFIGFCNSGKYMNRIVFPIVYFDKIIGYTGRATWLSDDKKHLKYKHHEGTPIGNMIWGLYSGYKKENPIFVEGILDAIKLRIYGLNAYTCFNNNITETQVKIIDGSFDDKIYIMPDNDNGGDDMKKRFIKKLSKRKEIFLCKIKKIDGDPDSILKNEAIESFKNSEKITNIQRVKKTKNVTSIVHTFHKY